MRKKQLSQELNRSKERIRQLEDLICPVESHDWKVIDSNHYFNGSIDIVRTETTYMCTKCRKIKVKSEWR